MMRLDGGFCEHAMEGSEMTTTRRRTSEMYPGIATMQPIMVGRHQDFMEEARQRRLGDEARAGMPRRSRLMTSRRLIGLAMVSLGQRVAGTTGEALERLPVKPALRGVR